MTLPYGVGNYRNKALAGLEVRNARFAGVLEHIDPTHKVGATMLPDRKLRGLVERF